MTQHIHYESLVAQAIALCEELLESTLEPSPFSRVLRTHLAEFREHDKVYDKGGIDYEPSWSCVYDNCYETTGKNTPCDLIVTKAQRLLGEASK